MVSHETETGTILRRKQVMKAILSISLCVVLGALGVSARAQTPEEIPASSLVSKSTVAIGFTVGGGSTKVDLIGTELMPQANGEAKVEAKAKAGLTNVEVTVKGLTPPSKLGAEYLTFVLWTVTPEGHTGNAGEIIINKDGDGKMTTTTPAQ